MQTASSTKTHADDSDDPTLVVRLVSFPVIAKRPMTTHVLERCHGNMLHHYYCHNNTIRPNAASRAQLPTSAVTPVELATFKQHLASAFLYQFSVKLCKKYVPWTLGAWPYSISAH